MTNCDLIMASRQPWKPRWKWISELSGLANASGFAARQHSRDKCCRTQSSVWLRRTLEKPRPTRADAQRPCTYSRFEPGWCFRLRADQPELARYNFRWLDGMVGRPSHPKS